MEQAFFTPNKNQLAQFSSSYFHLRSTVCTYLKEQKPTSCSYLLLRKDARPNASNQHFFLFVATAKVLLTRCRCTIRANNILNLKNKTPYRKHFALIYHHFKKKTNGKKRTKRPYLRLKCASFASFLCLCVCAN